MCFVVICSRRFRLSAQSPAIENNSFGIANVFFVVTCSRRFRLLAQSPAIENNSFGIADVCIEYESISQSLYAGQIFDSHSVEGVGENEIRIKQRLSVGQIFDSRSVEGEARNLRKKDSSPHTRACKARFSNV